MAKAKQEDVEKTPITGTVKVHCGTVLMGKKEGYTAGPSLREGEVYEIVPFGGDNGYVAILIPGSETVDAYHVWVDGECIDVPEE
jgi:hypothetical protein